MPGGGQTPVSAMENKVHYKTGGVTKCAGGRCSQARADWALSLCGGGCNGAATAPAHFFFFFSESQSGMHVARESRKAAQ